MNNTINKTHEINNKPVLSKNNNQHCLVIPERTMCADQRDDCKIIKANNPNMCTEFADSYGLTHCAKTCGLCWVVYQDNFNWLDIYWHVLYVYLFYLIKRFYFICYFTITEFETLLSINCFCFSVNGYFFVVCTCDLIHFGQYLFSKSMALYMTCR